MSVAETAAKNESKIDCKSQFVQCLTVGKIGKCIANAVHDLTFLTAGVVVLANHKLLGINRTMLDNILLRFAALMKIKITDRFGRSSSSTRMVFLPLITIDEVEEKSLTECLFRDQSMMIKGRNSNEN